METHEDSPRVYVEIWASWTTRVFSSIAPEPWAGPAAEMKHLTAQSLNFGTLESYRVLVSLSIICSLKRHELISATHELAHCVQGV